jgi:uncharacterized membrane protein
MQVISPAKQFTNVHPVERVISTVGGAALAATGIRRGARGIPATIAGLALAARGVTGRCNVYRAFGVRTAKSTAAIPYELGIRARAAVTVNAPRERVYDFWRQLDNLPRFMRHLVSVDQLDYRRSRWVAQGPAGWRVTWDAEVINEIPNELLAWQSLAGSQVDSAGSVRFTEAPGGRGTEIRVELQYNPPAGIVGAYVARLFGREPEQEIEADLNRLKQFLECGEVATTDGQPHARLRHERGALEEAIA